MRIITPGKWLEDGLHLEMTAGELKEWLKMKPFPPYEIYSQKGNHSTVHYYSIHGLRVIVYETEEETSA